MCEVTLELYRMLITHMHTHTDVYSSLSYFNVITASSFANFLEHSLYTYITFVTYLHTYSAASERPTASILLKHQFVQIGISNDEEDTTGGNEVATTATSAGMHYYIL